MVGELSRIERAALQKMHERGGMIRVDSSSPGQRGLHWLLRNLAERGYVKVASHNGSHILYQLQPRPVAVAERDSLPVALRTREYGR